MTGEKDPFGDIDRAFNQMLQAQIDTVRAIDGLEQDLNTWECDFIQNILNQLEKGKRPLTQKQIEVVRRMCDDHDVECDF